MTDQRAGRFLPPAAHLRQRPTVLLEDDAAAWLVRETNLSAVLRSRGRDADRAVVSQISALIALGRPLASAASANGSEPDVGGGERESLATSVPVFPLDAPGLTASQVAEQLHLTARAVRQAAADGRLHGTQRGGVWWFQQIDVDRYEPRRTA